MSKLPPLWKGSSGPRRCWEKAEVGNRWAPLPAPVGAPLLLQFCLHVSATGRKQCGEMLGDKEEGKRRGGLPSFFEGKQIDLAKPGQVKAPALTSVHFIICNCLLIIMCQASCYVPFIINCYYGYHILSTFTMCQV